MLPVQAGRVPEAAPKVAVWQEVAEEVTDEELRIKLADKLGIPIWKSSVTGAEYVGLPHPSPSLSELVATGEGRLTEEQKSDYGEAVAAVVLHIGARSGLSGFGCYKLITAPAAVRARALMEVLK